MMKKCKAFVLLMIVIHFTLITSAQRTPGNITLSKIMLRDTCILPDKKPAPVICNMIGPDRRASVVQYTSKDLVNWYGPKTIFQTTADFWGDTAI